MDETEWRAREDEWIATPDDRAYVASLMECVTEPGQFANWIAPPKRGINNQDLDFAYVKFTGHERS